MTLDAAPDNKYASATMSRVPRGARIGKTGKSLGLTIIWQTRISFSRIYLLNWKEKKTVGYLG